MSQRYDPSRHHRRSIRLKRYDYTQPWAYFVTICTVQRAHLFGDVVDGEMRLSEYGVIVREEWFRLAEIRQEIELYEDELVLMPNHIHGIVWIVEAHEGAHGIGGVYGIGVGVHGSAPPTVRVPTKDVPTRIPTTPTRSLPVSNPRFPGGSISLMAQPVRPHGSAIIGNTLSATTAPCMPSDDIS